LKEKTQLKVTILGTSLMVQSDEDAEHLQAVLTYFEKKVGEVKKKLPGTEPVKLAIITGLNLVDELLKIQSVLKKNSNSEDLEAERITRRMIQKLDNILTP
jgi:cell division protein ZapA (FtsZ GTPase activity inhibitor)